MAAVSGACGPDIQVRTAASPEAFTLSGRRTFTVVEATDVQTSANFRGSANARIADDPELATYGVNDPMIDNSITAQAVHDQIRDAFVARGYRYTKKNPDFVVRYTASIAPILDVRTYNVGSYGYYGYGYNGYNYPYGGYCCDDGFGYVTASYDRPTVVIDAVDPNSDKLLWRGQGTAGMYSDPKSYMKELRHAVNAVAKKFPVGRAPVPYTASR